MLVNENTTSKILNEKTAKITNACLESSHYPNAETLLSIATIEKRENLVKVKSLDELAKKLGL